VVPGADWEQAFHGTWWYAVWLVLDSGVLLESNDKASGHDFWEPGVYCTPVLETARWYARPHVLFGDGAYHRVLFELRVDPERRKRQRQRGGVQWVFNSSAVSIHAMWVEINAPPDNGEERVNEWDPGLEALPSGRDRPELVVNPRDFASDCGRRALCAGESWEPEPPRTRKRGPLAVPRPRRRSQERRGSAAGRARILRTLGAPTSPRTRRRGPTPRPGSPRCRRRPRRAGPRQRPRVPAPTPGCDWTAMARARLPRRGWRRPRARRRRGRRAAPRERSARGCWCRRCPRGPRR
ncbi:unnamed protein product, partial [Prorocentrum cordatum]